MITTLLKFKTSRFGLKGLVFLVLAWSSLPQAQTRCRPQIYTPKIAVVDTKLMSFQPPRRQRITTFQTGKLQTIEYQEAVVLRVELLIEPTQVCALPPVLEPRLYIGPFESYLKDHGENQHGLPRLVFHLPHFEQFAEGDPIVVSYSAVPWSWSEEDFQNYNAPRFSQNMIVDKRWTVFGGLVYQDTDFELRGWATGPHATVTVNGGNLSLTTDTNQYGVFRFNYPDGITLEEGELYTVKVVINDVVLFSKTITRETADFPKWDIKLKPQESTFEEIKGHVYDAAGAPLPDVTLTLDEHHSTTTDEQGYIRLIGLFAGTYTLTASKEGYLFEPVSITGHKNETVTVELVESRPTRCLLYAVHDTAQTESRLVSVDLSEETFEVKPLDLTPPAHDVSIAVADFDGDDTDEIALAAKEGGHTVTLYELDGTVIRSFPVNASGISLAAGDIDGDGVPGIIVASRAANRQEVLVYAADGTALSPVAMFENKTRMSPAVGDVDGDDKADIIVGSLLKEDQVAIYQTATQALSHFSVFQSRSRKKTDNAGQGITYGVNVASADFNDDDKADIVAAQASKGSQVEVYSSDGTLLHAWTAFDKSDGIVVTAGNVIDDSLPEIIVGEAKGSRIRGFNLKGEKVFELKAVESGTISSLTTFRCEESEIR